MANPARANGSEPFYQSSFPTLNEVAAWLQVPTDVLRSKLLNQGLWVAPHDRYPPEVIIDALEREGYQPERLDPINR